MISRTPAPPTARRSPTIVVAALLVVIAAISGAGCQLLAAQPSTAAATTEVPGGEPPPTTPYTTAPAPSEIPPGVQGGALGEADGAIPAGTTVFDGGVPGVANLRPALLSALRRAAGAAAGKGIELLVDSGWRSPRYQEQLLQEAASKYGSEAEAARWVATPATSAHVSGDAADIGHSDATAWLSRHGAAYGLCQIYRNEPWHYELRSEAIDHGCPRMYADPTQDPRMQR